MGGRSSRSCRGHWATLVPRLPLLLPLRLIIVTGDGVLDVLDRPSGATGFGAAPGIANAFRDLIDAFSNATNSVTDELAETFARVS